LTVTGLTKYKYRQDGVLEQRSDFEENGPHERILPILGDLSVKDPYPGIQLNAPVKNLEAAYEASIPIVKALNPFLLL
jgi:hypothetical protein